MDVVDVDMDLVTMMMMQLEDELFRDLQPPPTTADPSPDQLDKSQPTRPSKRQKEEAPSRERRSVAARHRRRQINDRMRVLQRMVPGGTKMDTASMLEEAVKYVIFLKDQVQVLETAVNVVALATESVGGGRSSPPTLEPWSYLSQFPQEADLWGILHGEYIATNNNNTRTIANYRERDRSDTIIYG